MLRGSAVATIDDKGRLKVPADLRRTLEERWGSDLLSPPCSAALIYRCRSGRRSKAACWRCPPPTGSGSFPRTGHYYGQQLRHDGQGRLVMRHPARARIAGVVVSGSLDHLVVWNRDRFVRKLSEEPFTGDDFQASPCQV